MRLRLLGLLLLSISFNACATLRPADGQAIIGPYPTIGSLEEKQDFDELLYFQDTRTQEQCEAGAQESSSSLRAFFGGKNGPLSEAEVIKVQKNLKWVTIKTGVQILLNKTAFNRPRPYTNHPEIKPCIELELSKAYPSGHATLSRVYARILSVIYPERSIQFLNRADQIALNRVIGGVHHPSDIVAGKKLGDALADTYLSDDEFNINLEQIANFN